MAVAPEYALSLKQPWAALVMQGLKSVEIRSWPTVRRGRIYIHAARSTDDRQQGWDLVTPAIEPLTQLQGGLIGTVDLIDCLTYRSREEFARDTELHRNDPSWYAGTLYGFRLADPLLTDFLPLPGWFRFFRIDRTEKK